MAQKRRGFSSDKQRKAVFAILAERGFLSSALVGGAVGLGLVATRGRGRLRLPKMLRSLGKGKKPKSGGSGTPDNKPRTPAELAEERVKGVGERIRQEARGDVKRGVVQLRRGFGQILAGTVIGGTAATIEEIVRLSSGRGSRPVKKRRKRREAGRDTLGQFSKGHKIHAQQPRLASGRFGSKD